MIGILGADAKPNQAYSDILSKKKYLLAEVGADIHFYVKIYFEFRVINVSVIKTPRILI
jgi:hypothetical protein